MRTPLHIICLILRRAVQYPMADKSLHAYAKFCGTIMKTLLLAAALIALSAPARAEQHQCVLYIEQQDQQLHVHNPVCFDSKGDVVVGSADRIMHVSARNENCTTIIEGVERVDSSTYLVRTYCKGRKPERKTLVFQLIDDGDGGTLRITNAESS